MKLIKDLKACERVKSKWHNLFEAEWWKVLFLDPYRVWFDDWDVDPKDVSDLPISELLPLAYDGENNLESDWRYLDKNLLMEEALMECRMKWAQ